MDRIIEQKLEQIRRYAASEPSSVTTVKLRDGAFAAQATLPGLTEYFDFLKESNGARFGIVDLFGIDLLAGSSSGTGAPSTEWYRIGQILYDPLLVHQYNGLLAVYDRLHAETKELGVRFGEFLRDFLLGPRYVEISPNPTDDRWYRTLSVLGLLGR